MQEELKNSQYQQLSAQIYRTIALLNIQTLLLDQIMLPKSFRTFPISDKFSLLERKAPS